MLASRSARPVAALLALCAATCLARTAAAQSATLATCDDASRTLKQQGDAAFDAHEFGDAATLYRRAYERCPDSTLLWNQSGALRARGEYASALSVLEAFQKRAPPDILARVPELGDVLVEVRGRVATLTVTCSVPGARVIVRDKIVGTTPLPTSLQVDAGAAVIEVSADGYRTFRRAIDLKGGGSETIDARLALRDNTGVLELESPTPGAVVLVDGKVVGHMPAEQRLTAGTHRVVVRADGYAERRTTAVIIAGGRKHLSVTLDEEQPSLVSRWWFWTGVVTVVAGGTALTIALLTERGPDTGTLNPGQASAPLMHW